MIVVADSSPLNVLIRLDYQTLLPRLFQNVVIPIQVADELIRSSTPGKVRVFMANPPSWLQVLTPSQVEPIPGVHPGEEAAISLARELKADLLLIDDRDGRKAAVERQVPITGTIGVLERAADQGLLDLSLAFERIKKSDFRFPHRLLDLRLQLYQQRRAQHPSQSRKLEDESSGQGG